MSRKKVWRLAGLNHLLKRDGHPLSLSSALWEEKCSAVNSDVIFTVDFDLREESEVSFWRVQAAVKLPEHEQGTGNSKVLTGCREAKALGWRMPQVCHRCGACSASPELCSLYARIVVWWLLFLIYPPAFISLTDFTQELLPVVRRQPGGISTWYWEILMSLVVPVGPLSIMSREGGRRWEVRKSRLQSRWPPSPLMLQQAEAIAANALIDFSSFIIFAISCSVSVDG